jgi:transposase
MTYGAIDLHKKESQIRIVAEDGAVIDRRIATRRDAFTRLFGERPPMRVLVEASTESEWVACHLESLGHEVIVADPNYAAMYGGRSRRIKTDLRDVAALTTACTQGIYRAIHRRSAARRAVQAQLRVRDELVDARGRAISLVRALTRAEGLRLRSGSAETFARRLADVALSPSLAVTVAPVCRLLSCLNEEIRHADTRLAELVTTDPDVARLTTLPGIGPITAAAFVAALDDVRRFRRAGQVANYLGLVPREYSSGEQQRRGHIVRSAHPRVQALLVQAAWRIWISKRPDTAALRTWAQLLARRRSPRIAIVALARRLARILYGMWRDESPYQSPRPRAATTSTQTATAMEAVRV